MRRHSAAELSPLRRCAIFIPSYNAARTLRDVIARIPAERVPPVFSPPAEQQPIDADTRDAGDPRGALWLRDEAERVGARLDELDARAKRSGSDGPASPMMSPEIEAQLRALGYAVEQ